jgi:hypothetical protein
MKMEGMREDREGGGKGGERRKMETGKGEGKRRDWQLRRC